MFVFCVCLVVPILYVMASTVWQHTYTYVIQRGYVTDRRFLVPRGNGNVLKKLLTILPAARPYQPTSILSAQRLLSTHTHSGHSRPLVITHTNPRSGETWSIKEETAAPVGTSGQHSGVNCTSFWYLTEAFVEKLVVYLYN